MSEEKQEVSPESLLSPQAAPESQEVASEAVAENKEESSWFYDEGVPGKGEAPEWFDSEKYKTVVDAAKGIKGLRQKLGSFTGAPEAYEHALPEDGSLEGIEIDVENALYKDFTEYAKTSNMSNEAFNKAVNMYLQFEASENREIGREADTFRSDEMKKLGDNAAERLGKVSNWISANVPEKHQQTLTNLATTSDFVEVLEHFQNKSFSTPMPTNAKGGGMGTALPREEIFKILRGEGDLGRKYQRDQGFQEEISQMLQQYDADQL